MGDRAREAKIAARRQSWAGRQWRTSEHGNSFVNVRGYNIVVFGSRKGWGISITQRYGERRQFGKQRYSSRVAAQAAAFEALLWAERTWGGNGRYDLPSTAMQPTPL
jgi:hypothetical protein